MKTVKSVLTITIVCSLFSFIVFLFGCFINDDSTFCKVVYIAGEGGTIDGIAEQEIRYGEDATTVIAVPNDGYKFVKWSDGITTQERQDKNITADKSVAAEFAKIKITVTYTATSIKDCTTNVEICGDTYYDAGGFIGRVDVASNTSLQILNSAVYGDITMGNVGGFIGRGSCFGVLNIEKCHTEGVINILSRGAGFIFMYNSNSMANVLIKDCYSCGDIVGGADSSKEGLYSGSAAGFCFNVSNLNLIKCFVECEIFASSGTGFIYTLGNCNVEQCYFSGIIYAENTNVGFCRGIFGSRIKNCYVAGKIISENSRIVRGFSQVCQSSEIINCYFAIGLLFLILIIQQ